jgi:hypothetical protein
MCISYMYCTCVYNFISMQSEGLVMSKTGKGWSALTHLHIVHVLHYYMYKVTLLVCTCTCSNVTISYWIACVYTDENIGLHVCIMVRSLSSLTPAGHDADIWGITRGPAPAPPCTAGPLGFTMFILTPNESNRFVVAGSWRREGRAVMIPYRIIIILCVINYWHPILESSCKFQR